MKISGRYCKKTSSQAWRTLTHFSDISIY